MSNITDLSKSRYCKGIQCPKMLWLDAYKPQEAEDILPESVLANGTLVGDLARSYFGEYSLVDFSFDKTEMVHKTNELMQSGAENIAEAAFEHKEFLGKEGTDPRRALAEQLVEDIPTGACSLAFNMSFEKTVIKEIAKQFPDLSEQLMDIHDNMHDLMIPFKDQDYYSKAMQGSYSIKYVLPALYPDDPELDYHNLDGIHNGSEASNAFAEMATHTPEEIAEMRANLLRYCGLDTYAMVKVLRKLREAIGD